MARQNRIPNPESPHEVRQAFQRLVNTTDFLLTGPPGYILVGAGDGVTPVWGTELTSLTKITVDSITIDAATIISDTGAISFGNENLTTTGTIAGINVTSGSDPGHTHTSASVPEHGELIGLGDDDHGQYHNNTRGDARYYTRTLLDGGQLDSRYYTETELDGGQLDNRYYTETELDAGQLDNRYYTETELNAGQLDNLYFGEDEFLNSSAGAGDAGKPVILDAAGHIDATMINDGDIDHGSIGGLAGDDHSQYHNDARGDARYYTETELDAGQLDNRYYTETEIDAAYGPYETETDINVVTGQPLYIKSNAHVALAAADNVDTSRVIGLATEDISSGNTAKYNVDGKLYIADWTAIVGAATLIPGVDYYLDVSAAASGTPDYANAGGTGNRTAIITVSSDISIVGALTELIEGAFQDGTFWFSQNTAITGEYLRFDFGVGVSKIITEAKWYQGTAPNTQGVWQWQGSDNASDWTNIGSTFTLGGAGTQTQTELSANSYGYRYYQLFGISGTAGPFPTYIREIEFKIDDYTPPVGDGQLTDTAPSSTGEYVVRVGLAISTTVLDIEVARPILL